jgi:hypothetical protein
MLPIVSVSRGWALQEGAYRFWTANLVAALMFLGLHLPGWYITGALGPSQAGVGASVVLGLFRPRGAPRAVDAAGWWRTASMTCTRRSCGDAPRPQSCDPPQSPGGCVASTAVRHRRTAGSTPTRRTRSRKRGSVWRLATLPFTCSVLRSPVRS